MIMITYCEFCAISYGSNHARYKSNIIKNKLGSFLIIEDLENSSRSVKNDIDYVLWDNWKQYSRRLANDFLLDDYQVIYQDSKGVYDGIKIKGNKFDGFYPINKILLLDAMQAIKNP